MILTLNLRPDVTVLAVPVDPGSYSFCQFYFKESYEVGGLSFYNAKTYQTSRLPLPPGSYELIGLLREVTEDVLGELLICQDSVLGPGMVYWSYTSESFTCPTAIISMKDAIYKAGGDPKQNWLIITKK